MPSDILRGGNATIDAIIMIQWLQLLNFELSGCHLAPFSSKVFNCKGWWLVKMNPQLVSSS